MDWSYEPVASTPNIQNLMSIVFYLWKYLCNLVFDDPTTTREDIRELCLTCHSLVVVLIPQPVTLSNISVNLLIHAFIKDNFINHFVISLSIKIPTDVGIQIVPERWNQKKEHAQFSLWQFVTLLEFTFQNNFFNCKLLNIYCIVWNGEVVVSHL